MTPLKQEIATAIAHEGPMTLERYMALCLAHPRYGYYMTRDPFGAGGDFVTAPEIGSLFGRTLARQAAQILSSNIPDIVELGAGSGRLARDLLAGLAKVDSLPRRYLILETSADLRQRQRELLRRDLPQLVERITWLDALPDALDALVIGNEVLDAMPVHVITASADSIDERGVTHDGDEFAWRTRPAAGALLEAAQKLDLAAGYTTEISLASLAFMRTLAQHLRHGVAILIDYGFPAREYYHPQRASGTLMCHYRQHAHDDPLCLAGLQDITAHVDFSAIADAALQSGLDLLGYTNQAQFLINCGITDLLAETPADNISAYLPLAAQAQKLMSPAEMGELFKVIAFGRNHRVPLAGFASGNKLRLL